MASNGAWGEDGAGPGGEGGTGAPVDMDVGGDGKTVGVGGERKVTMGTSCVLAVLLSDWRTRRFFFFFCFAREGVRFVVRVSVECVVRVGACRILFDCIKVPRVCPCLRGSRSRD